MPTWAIRKVSAGSQARLDGAQPGPVVRRVGRAQVGAGHLPGEEGRVDGADPPGCERVVQAGLGGCGRLAIGRGGERAPGVEHELAVPPPDDGSAVGAGERAADVAHLHEERVAVGVLEQRRRTGRVERAEQGVA